MEISERQRVAAALRTYECARKYGDLLGKRTNFEFMEGGGTVVLAATVMGDDFGVVLADPENPDRVWCFLGHTHPYWSDWGNHPDRPTAARSREVVELIADQIRLGHVSERKICLAAMRYSDLM